MTARRGFTLLETIVAISLTAIVVTIAGVALDAAGTARATIARHQATREVETRLRAMLTDMLRHAPRADAVDEPLLQLARTPTGASLVFLSRGVVQPFGTGPAWRVTLASDADGVVLDALPLGSGSALPAPLPAPLHARLPHLAGIDVTVLEGTGDASLGGAAWRADWPVQRSRPALVRIGFVARGAEAGATPPLVVPLSPVEGAR